MGNVTEHYDVVIVGTGAGGGTLAHTLASSGKRILLLERGDFLPREMDNWDPGSVFVDGKYISSDTWYDADGEPFQPQVHYFVGGATKLYGAALYRLRPGDFGELKHADGVSPAWPLTYDEFEPWYTRAEWLYQVHGVFWLTTEDVPKPGNRVTVDRDGSVHLAYAPTNATEAAGLYHELRKILNHVGMAQHHVLDKNFYMNMNIPIAGCAHQAGTCRFGHDPATSVLDVNCKAHELDNLYVVDTSIFPSIGAVNPALTAMANAIRVGEHLLSRMS
jgi:choline dehydrogenase-like flavoprotein